MAKCLVTGGAGFIGSHLVDRLVADGHEVDVVDLRVSEHEKVYRCTFDVCCDSFLNWALWTPDVIFHLAAISRTPDAILRPGDCLTTNVHGTQRVLEFARDSGCPRVVVSSSNVVYAAPTPYKASKLAAEHFCEAYNHVYGLSVIALRYSNVYGSRLRKGDPAVFSSFRDSAKDKGYIEITGDGEQSRDFTHVSDIVEGNILAWKSDHKGIVDLCTGRNLTLNQVCQVGRVVGSCRGGNRPGDASEFYSGAFRCPVRYIPERLGDVKHIIQHPEAAWDILGWEPKIRLEDRFSDIFEF
jgi:UDP-glucose 4-epimerase